MNPKAVLKHTRQKNIPTLLCTTILVLSLSVEIAAAKDDRDASAIKQRENLGSLWQFYSTTWAVIYRAWGESDWALYVIGSWLAPFSAFCITNFIFGTLDVFGSPRFLQKYKIQKDRNVPMSFRKYLWTATVATFNMTVVTLANLTTIWPLARRRMSFGYQLPTPLQIIIHLLLCVMINEIGFYYLHRLMHTNPFLYKNVHKMHHDWKAPCSMATFYCHPLEHFFVNLGPFVLAPALVGTHLSVAWFYFVAGLLSTTLGHCGYHFPLLPSSQSHDYHHQKSRDNYGTIGLLDRLHKSDSLFKRSLNFKRHFTSFSLTPVDELVKDS